MFTVETLANGYKAVRKAPVVAVIARVADDPMFLILGADELAAFPHWKDPDGIIKRARIVGYPRTKESSTKIRDRIGGANFNPREIPGKVLKTAVIFLR